MKHQSHPIVVVRKKKSKHGGGHHGGSWKIAYADFMTAMMAFFLVMWLISISSPKELVQIAEYFRTPLAVAITGGPRSSDATSPIPGGGEDPTVQDGEVHKMIQSQGDARELRETGDLKKLQEKLEEMLASDPRLKGLRPHLMINLTEQGLRIQIIDSKNRPMFQLGSAIVEPYMRDILRAIGPVLDDFPNKISLAGHTDDMPYAQGERGYSNWELSTDRANASRREMIIGGLSEGKVLRVMGMGSTMQLKNHPAGDAINRRISILVLNRHAEEAIERENSEGEAITISDAGELQRQVPGRSTAPALAPKVPATQSEAPQAQSAPSVAPTMSPVPVPVAPAVAAPGLSAPTTTSAPMTSAPTASVTAVTAVTTTRIETQAPVTPSANAQPATAAPVAAAGTAPATTSTSRDSQ